MGIIGDGWDEVLTAADFLNVHWGHYKGNGEGRWREVWNGEWAVEIAERGWDTPKTGTHGNMRRHCTSRAFDFRAKNAVNISVSRRLAVVVGNVSKYKKNKQGSVVKGYGRADEPGRRDPALKSIHIHVHQFHRSVHDLL